MKPVYLDYNATTPIDKEVAEAMQPYLTEHFGNPSSSHWFGIQTKKAVEKARAQSAELLGCDIDEVIFTSGGSESNNYAIKGAAMAYRNRGDHVITTAVEHPAVLEVCRYLEMNGFRISVAPVDRHGMVSVQEIEKLITPQTILITVMHANNEVGTIQPVREIAETAKKNGILMHTDAAQSVGKIPVNVNELGVDLLSAAGHKFYAPKGIGALFIRRGTELEKLVHGADHEQNRRAGTENVLEIVGIGKAAEIAKRDLNKNSEHMKRMRDRLHEGLKENCRNIALNGHPEKRLPNTLSIGFRGIEANTLLSELEDVAASAGAACHADQVDVSSVLEAMKTPVEYAMGTVRFSTGKLTTADEVDRAVNRISEAVKRLSPRETEDEPVVLTGTGDDVKLTHFTHGLGCACKIQPQSLEKILEKLPVPTDPSILVGAETSDDAAVYRLSDNLAAILTLDFFTPIVDSPYYFGAIAAANALSDIYAMGGKPVMALNIVGFPAARLPLTILETILKGASDKAEEAGISILGGHTVDDTEPKYGMAVMGILSPDAIITNRNAQPGDALILTKPLGTGIITTAGKRGLADERTMNEAIEIMSALNHKAAQTMMNYPVNACTDITGFGLMGHLKEMTQGSRTDAVIYAEKTPIIPKARDFAAANVVPGGSLSNVQYVSTIVDWDKSVSQLDKILLCDAQTSGGLLISLPAQYEESFLQELKKQGIKNAAGIGYILQNGSGKINVKSMKE